MLLGAVPVARPAGRPTGGVRPEMIVGRTGPDRAETDLVLDLDGSGTVDPGDLLAILAGWTA